MKDAPIPEKVGRPEPNCMSGYPVYNRHNNCPYSLLCAVCDIDAEQQDASSTDRSGTV